MNNSPHNFSHIRKFFDKNEHCQVAKILPGEFYACSKKEVISTVLGSCVAACLYVPHTGIGGMNHFMLPGNKNDSDSSSRYGLFAMESLINSLLKMGVSKEKLVAKLFGGGKIIEGGSDIGQQNIRFARKFLHAEGIPIEVSDLGSIYPRKVNFYPMTGKVRVKKLDSVNKSEVCQKEQEYQKSLEQKPVSGDIELF